jgi:kojibiose phosphorylase
MYRYRRLPQARANAQAHGYSGAMFPWESADTGVETTPAWHKDLDGTIKAITTGAYEHHITADIAYAIYQYWLATEDDDFMLRFGLEMMIESARFWTSRVQLNPRRNQYEILHVTGPDEFHEDINNNTFTNIMAKWNLTVSSHLYRQWLVKKPAAVKRLGERLVIKTGEVGQWEKIALQIYIPRKGDLIEAFSGFFKLKHLPLPEVDDYFIPVMPKMPARELAQTQYVKQADTVMLLYLLKSEFSHEEMKANYYFYEERTLHKSSLSPALYGTIASWLGDLTKARRYLNASLVTDLKNVHGNTHEGVHTASLGGTWQAMFRGFAGVQIEHHELILDPRLPVGWKSLAFSMMWKGGVLWIAVEQEQIKLRWEPEKRKELSVQIHGVRRKVPAHRTIAFPYLRTRWLKKASATP